MSSADREYQRCIRWYQDETGIMEYQPSVVAEWLKARGCKMPKPPTDVDVLAKRLSRAARSDRRPVPGATFDYRGQLSYKRRVDGQLEFFWFDADGPAATPTNVFRALRMRVDQAINIGVRAKADAIHFAQTHPGQTIELNFDLEEEITWRMNAPGADDEQKAAG